MSLTVLVEFQAKPEATHDLKTFFKEILPDTRKYQGCQSIYLYNNQQDANQLILIEQWDSHSHYDKYLAWRKETGVLDRIGGMLDSPPSIRYFERIDA